MAGITIKNITSKNNWEEFLSKHPEANFLQSWYWGEFHESLNHKIFRSGFCNSQKLVGVMLSVVEEAKRGRYLTVPGGPIIDWKDNTQVEVFLDEIKRIAKEEKCVFVRVRPQLELNDFSKDLFGKLGFRKAPTHLHAELTSQLDITKSEDELMAGMRKATRYEIRKGLKEEIRVTTTTDPKHIKEFYNTQMETAKRQKFVPFSYEFLFNQFKIFSENKMAYLYRAHYGKKLLAEAFIIFYGKEAVYHYGASTDEGRNHPGAYLIQWEAIKEAKKRGISRYNFWGVAPEDQKNHRFSGLSLFKRGFGGQDFSYLNAHDLVIDKPRYLINATIENIRRKLRKL